MYPFTELFRQTKLSRAWSSSKTHRGSGDITGVPERKTRIPTGGAMIDALGGANRLKTSAIFSQGYEMTDDTKMYGVVSINGNIEV